MYVNISLADAVPPVSTVAPPVVVASPPGVVSPSGACPAPVGDPGVPVVLPTAFCMAPPSSSSSPAASVSAPSPCVPAVLGAGVDTGPPPGPGLVPHVVEDAAVLRRASVRLTCVARVSESTSSSDDVWPEPKRFSAFIFCLADVGKLDDCGSSGDSGLAPVASHSTVAAEVHMLADASAGVSAFSSGVVPVDHASGASPASDGSGSL
ncbi:uncharacterized protein [Procambarus clarkii]|uniref:uncharacterized protein n=1 Tax=Procambarus clarkii TaxID=6728 RepID=UPI003742C920